MSLASLIQHRNRLRRDLANDLVPQGMLYAALNTLRRLDINILAQSNRTRIPVTLENDDVAIDMDVPEPRPSTLPRRSLFSSNGAYEDEAEVYYTHTGKRIRAFNE